MLSDVGCYVMLEENDYTSTVFKFMIWERSIW